MMDGMVVIGGPMDMMALGVMMVMEILGRLLGLRIVHTWILPLLKVVIMEVGLLLRRLLLFWLLSVLLALRRRRDTTRVGSDFSMEARSLLLMPVMYLLLPPT